jgi:hypothetical protein
MLANVIWPFHGALFAQWIPLFLFIEVWIVHLYFKDVPKGKLIIGVLSANLFSTLAGALLVMPLAAPWDPLVTRASEQINACVLAFLVTVPLEFLNLAWFRCFVPSGRRFRACVMMNLATYAVCLAVVVYHWRWGAYAE